MLGDPFVTGVGVWNDIMTIQHPIEVSAYHQFCASIPSKGCFECLDGNFPVFYLVCAWDVEIDQHTGDVKNGDPQAQQATLARLAILFGIMFPPACIVVPHPGDSTRVAYHVHCLSGFREKLIAITASTALADFDGESTQEQCSSSMVRTELYS